MRVALHCRAPAQHRGARHTATVETHSDTEDTQRCIGDAQRRRGDTHRYGARHTAPQVRHAATAETHSDARENSDSCCTPRRSGGTCCSPFVPAVARPASVHPRENLRSQRGAEESRRAGHGQGEGARTCTLRARERRPLYGEPPHSSCGPARLRRQAVLNGIRRPPCVKEGAARCTLRRHHADLGHATNEQSCSPSTCAFGFSST